MALLWRIFSANCASLALELLAEATADQIPPVIPPAAPKPSKISGNKANSGKKPRWLLLARPAI